MNRHTAVTIIQKLASSDIYGAIDTILSAVQSETVPIKGGITIPRIMSDNWNKMNFIKVVRDVTKWDLVDCKDVTDSMTFRGSSGQWFEICRRQSEWLAVKPSGC